MLSQTVDLQFHFLIYPCLWVNGYLIFICFFFLFLWEIYSKSSSGFLPHITILFHMVRCVCKSHCPWELFFPRYRCGLCHMLVIGLLFLGLPLLLSRVAYQFVRILEKVCGNYISCHCVSENVFILLYLCIWMIVGTNFLPKFWKYSFIIFKFPVLASWSWSFVNKLFTLSPTWQESFNIIFLSPCPRKPHDVFDVGLFIYCAGCLVLYDLDTLVL